MPDSLLSVAIAKASFSFVLMAAIAAACAVFIRVLVAGLGLANRRLAAPAPAAPPPAPVVDAGVPPEVVAAISAAVSVAIGGHRIIWIGEDHAGGWTHDARHRHHASHNPHRDR